MNNKRIRVCYVLSTSEITGGANRSFIDLMKSIDRETIEPVALIRRQGDIEKELMNLSIPYGIIPYANAVKTGSFVKNIIKKHMPHFALKAVMRYLAENKIDIVHNNSVPVRTGMEAAYCLGIPYICHIRERIRDGLHTEFLNPKQHQQIINNASVIIAISEYIKNGYQLNEDKTLIINDGIDTEAYYCEKSIMNREDIRMSIYGVLNSQKGQMTAIKAMERLKAKGYDHVSLRIVGGSNSAYGQTAKEYVNNNALNNQVAFFEPIKDVRELWKSRSEDDINLICSNAEGLGRVTIESMLSNSLTIAADAGATPEIIEDKKTGLLFKVDDPESLEETIIYAIEHRDEMRTIADQGRAYASEHFDMGHYAEVITEIYKKMKQ